MAASGETLTSVASDDAIEIDGHIIEITSPDKVMVPATKALTKRDLVRYYAEMAAWSLPYLRGRPLTMQRFPEGITDKGFYQQQIPANFPPWIHRVELNKKDGVVTHVVCDDAATLAYLASQGCITPHVWLSLAKHRQYPDRLIFDLDPPDGNFESVRLVATVVRELLGELGLSSSAMTTGSRGLHLLTALDGRANFTTTRSFAKDVAAVLERRHPDLVTTAAHLAMRDNKLYVDVSRNSYAQSSVAPYSIRAIEGAPVATPLSWSELEDRSLNARSYHAGNIKGRLQSLGDPWKFEVLQTQPFSLGDARAKLDALIDHRA